MFLGVLIERCGLELGALLSVLLAPCTGQSRTEPVEGFAPYIHRARTIAAILPTGRFQIIGRGLAWAGYDPAIARSNFAVIRKELYSVIDKDGIQSYVYRLLPTVLYELFAPYFTTRHLPSFKHFVYQRSSN